MHKLYTNTCNTDTCSSSFQHALMQYIYKFSTHLYGFNKEKILLEQVCVVHFDSNESNYHYQVSDIIIQVRCLFNIHSMNSQVLFIVHLILTSLL